MKMRCECGKESYLEEVNTLCPDCMLEMVKLVPGTDMDVADYWKIQDQVFERIEASITKHGNWDGYSALKVFNTVSAEYMEYCAACETYSIAGPHGMIDELLDLAAVAMKGVRILSVLASAEVADVD